MSNDYADRQAAKDAQARRDYEALAPTLTPEQRAILLDPRTGTVSPAADYRGNDREEDAADLPHAGAFPEVADSLDRLEDLLAERFGLAPRQAAQVASWHRETLEREALAQLGIRLARVMGDLFDSSNLRADVVALMYATHTASANGLGSMRSVAPSIPNAAGQPCSVAYLSKRATHFRRTLNLPPGEGMKSDMAVQSYSAAQTEKHWRRSSKRLRRALDRLNPVPATPAATDKDDHGTES